MGHVGSLRQQRHKRQQTSHISFCYLHQKLIVIGHLYAKLFEICSYCNQKAPATKFQKENVLKNKTEIDKNNVSHRTTYFVSSILI